MMSLNRYRLKHLVKEKNRTAIRVSKLLDRTDRLLGAILTGNTFANILASAVATLLAVRIFGDIGVLISTVGLTFIVLIFAEITPKTVAALYSQRVAFLASLPLSIIQKLLTPIVWVVSLIANGFLRIFGINVKERKADRLSPEELRTVVMESKGRISSTHQDMLLRILDLGKVTVDDVMIPRNEVIGIDLEDNWNNILTQITTSKHTHLPVYRDEINNVEGMLNLRSAVKILAHERLDKDRFMQLINEAYFIPEGTPLTTQLLNFRGEPTHTALVVDEYGDVQGLVAIEDIIEEIIGEISTEEPSVSKQINQEVDGSYIIDGTANIRELNRQMEWHFPTKGPKTLSGLIIEYLEAIPEPNLCLRLHGYPIEVLKVKDNLVKSARIYADLYKNPEEEE